MRPSIVTTGEKIPFLVRSASEASRNALRSRYATVYSSYAGSNIAPRTFRAGACSVGPAMSTPRRASPKGRPVHHAKSAIVAGPWLSKYRRASSPSASSPSSLRDFGIHWSINTNVCCLPVRGPKQITPRIASTPRMWMPRWPVGATPPRASARYVSGRVTAPRASGRSRMLRLLVNAASSSSSARCRAPARDITRGASASVIQRMSSGATKWSVPRIGHVRTIARSAMARSTSRSVELVVRCPMPHSEPAKS